MFTTFAAAGHQVTELRVDMREANGTNNVTSFPFLDISAYCINLQDLPDCDVLLMLNDTFFIKHPWQILLRRMVSTLPLLASLPVPGASGSVHPTTDILMFDPSNPTRRHMSTFFFAANRLGIKVLQALAASLPGARGLAGRGMAYPAIRQRPSPPTAYACASSRGQQSLGLGRSKKYAHGNAGPA